MFKKSIIGTGLALVLTISFGCSESQKEDTSLKVPPKGAPILASKALNANANTKTLADIVNDRSDKDKARDKARNPVATLEFFRVAPGMTVAEALPGGGWYSKILAPYLGAEAELHGINYNDDMWARFGFFSDEQIKGAIASTSAFPETVKAFTETPPKTIGYTFSSAPKSLAGTVDRVLFIRALHNLSRFEKEAGTMTEALKTTKMLLKNGGFVGVIQHQAPESNSDEWANGSAGYLKKTAVIKAFTEAGFELVAESDINANAKDQPTEQDVVWRLPPSYNGTADNPELKKQVDAIGESNRMTLLFKKPE